VEKEQYRILSIVIVVAIGVVVAFGAVRSSWVLPILTVVIGLVLLVTLRRRVTNILYDERTVVIQQKAASRAMGYVTALTALLGLVLVELSYRGYSDYRLVGHAFIYQAYVMMLVYALFTWYYQRQLGG
jgi:uncharacterized membrane protein